jgi:hypothetical protein
MALTSKMAKWMKKQVKEVPKEDRSLKTMAKEEMKAIEMVNLSKKELEELAKGKGGKANTARAELDRRALKKEMKQGKEKYDEDLIGTPSTTDYKKFRSGLYNRGGAVKKPAAKKPAVKKPVKKGK